MDRRAFLAGASALTIATTAQAQTPPEGAEAALAEADARASASNRRLLVVFHASWCIYCRLFDMMLKNRDAGPIIDRYFVTLHMRAQERTPEMREYQLAGADDVYHRYAPEKAGLPYLVVLGEDSRKITDCMVKGENFGFPVKTEELDAFDAMMKGGAPGITHAELYTLHRVCKALMREHT